MPKLGDLNFLQVNRYATTQGYKSLNFNRFKIDKNEHKYYLILVFCVKFVYILFIKDYKETPNWYILAILKFYEAQVYKLRLQGFPREFVIRFVLMLSFVSPSTYSEP